MAEPEPDDLRALIHQVANLIAVVRAQSAAARAEGTARAAQRALDLIEECAGRTQRQLERVRKRP